MQLSLKKAVVFMKVNFSKLDFFIKKSLSHKLTCDKSIIFYHRTVRYSKLSSIQSLEVFKTVKYSNLQVLR